MSIVDIFSKRQKELRGELPDVYTYETIPDPLRVQVVHIWRDALGDERQYYDSYDRTTFNAYKVVVEALCREYGLFTLPGSEDPADKNYFSDLANFLLKESDTEKVLDAVELSFRYIDRLVRRNPSVGGSKRANDAIAELNLRFREHGVGYEYHDGQIIRIDSEFLHAETVKTALTLLKGTHEYAGAQAEFLTAHEHYRHGRAKEALSECLKALESLMKAICAKRGWACDPNATARSLLQVLFDRGLIPLFWAQHFSALRATLEAGVPTARNKLGGHGQGVQVVPVPEHLVAYVLHLTASAIVFLATAESVLTP